MSLISSAGDNMFTVIAVSITQIGSGVVLWFKVRKSQREAKSAKDLIRPVSESGITNGFSGKVLKALDDIKIDLRDLRADVRQDRQSLMRHLDGHNHDPKV